LFIVIPYRRILNLKHNIMIQQNDLNENEIHPDGKIRLLDGTLIDGYEKAENTPQHAEDGGMEPDTGELFLQNAFLLLAFKDLILSDSRMFLAYLPFGSPFTGGSNYATIGVFLEWWSTYEESIILSEEGQSELVYDISGNPMTGTNNCGLVDRQGKSRRQSLQNFRQMWHSFDRINKRYKEPKLRYEAYTLREVVDMLPKDEESRKYREVLSLCNLHQKLAVCMQNKVKALYGDINQLNRELKMTHIELKLDEVQPFYEEYKKQKLLTENKLKDLQEQRLEMRRQMGRGELTNKECGPRIIAINKSKEDLSSKLYLFGDEFIRAHFPEERLEIEDIEDFFKSRQKTTEE
jgi:hypothetical protein